jgi:hypothetical protein
MALADDLRALLNQVSREGLSDTPDYILARYMLGTLEVFESCTLERDRWYGWRETVMGHQAGPLIGAAAIAHGERRA